MSAPIANRDLHFSIPKVARQVEGNLSPTMQFLLQHTNNTALSKLLGTGSDALRQNKAILSVRELLNHASTLDTSTKDNRNFLARIFSAIKTLMIETKIHTLPDILEITEDKPHCEKVSQNIKDKFEKVVHELNDPRTETFEDRYLGMPGGAAMMRHTLDISESNIEHTHNELTEVDSQIQKKEAKLQLAQLQTEHLATLQKGKIEIGSTMNPIIKALFGEHPRAQEIADIMSPIIAGLMLGESQPTELKPAAKQILDFLSPHFQGTDFQRSAIELAKRTLEES